MFLLKPSPIIKWYGVFFCFTFHNVSIKTCSILLLWISIKRFTFHNVSIKTRIPDNLPPIAENFTFHNVSIKTGTGEFVHLFQQNFTFHNVSIKTPPSTRPHKINLILAHFVDLVLFLLEMIKILFFYYENGVFAGFWRIVDLPVFETHRISTEIREKSWYNHLLFPKILCPTISPVLI